MRMKLIRLNKADGTWRSFDESWEVECLEYEEDYASYAQASLGTLRVECDDGTPDVDTGVFALVDADGRFHAAAFMNRALLKGFDGKVLRVRHLILSPYYDFEGLELEDYGSILADFFIALVDCSEKTLKSQHIKIHYRSPYDRTFFASFGMAMRSQGHFGTVESKGMWLHLVKA